MADEEPHLTRLIDMVEEFNYRYVMKWLALEPDMMSYPEDLGMQFGPMLSPARLSQVHQARLPTVDGARP